VTEVIASLADNGTRESELIYSAELMAGMVEIRVTLVGEISGKEVPIKVSRIRFLGTVVERFQEETLLVQVHSVTCRMNH